MRELIRALLIPAMAMESAHHMVLCVTLVNVRQDIQAFNVKPILVRQTLEYFFLIFLLLNLFINSQYESSFISLILFLWIYPKFE